MKTIRSGYIYPWTYPSNWIRNIKELPRFIKRRFQRGRYGICLYDVWDLDSYMLQVFENGINELKNNHNGYPASLTSEEWENTLSKIEELIKIIKTEGVDCEEANKYYNSNSELWFKAVQEWEKYRQESLEELCDLMKKWFFDLWD